VTLKNIISNSNTISLLTFLRYLQSIDESPSRKDNNQERCGILFHCKCILSEDFLPQTPFLLSCQKVKGVPFVGWRTGTETNTPHRVVERAKSENNHKIIENSRK